ncbi:hypothetical protein Cgig2_026409 [Carnegiea gigantea]|uniref:Uncharacterized protein n=1 Tax=Carnegiea gigantea TaxID=171969 RepID=A0A9Q1K2Q4_9CARY|nr:hypothetical protein Cgig2_026409 [Carnegiea gigantea]
MFGHEEIHCKKKGGTRTKWRPIQKPTRENTIQLMQTEEQHSPSPMKEFTPVAKRNTTNYEVQIIQKSDQFIHNYVTQVSTGKKFYITYVVLWEDLKTISHQVTEAWCILGDFNTILCKEDRRGGNDIQGTETKEMAEFIEYGELHEMRWHRPYYSWTNKTVWSRIDRTLIDIHWYEKLVDSVTPVYIANPLNQLKTVMGKLQTLLSRLYKDNYADLKAQQELTRGELT